MNKLIKYFSIALLILIFISSPVLAQQSEILLVNDLEPGQKGIAKTVFRGVEIEEFNIEIIDIIAGQNVDSNLILIKAYGDKIENAGGIASGMSGSPVYIDDKLIGAISYKWQNSDHNYALVTPIIDMLNLTVSDLSYYDKLKTLNTPIMVGGLSGRALDRLKNSLNIDNSRFVTSSSTAGKASENFKLKPGSAIAVQLVRGDVNVSSIGTVTHVDKSNVYAFGHPFMNKGESNYLLSGAYIDAIIPSDEQPFKIGSPLDKLLGIIETDRSAGILGKLNKFPSIIPLTVKVNDKSRNISKEVRVQIIDDELLLRELGSSIVLQSIDSTIDRIGSGTAKVEIDIMGSNLPDGEIKKVNMYHSSQDIAISSLSDLYRMMDLITRNPFKKINIYDMEVDINVNNNDSVALIQEAKVLNEEIYPGSELKVNIVLRPYRSDAINREVTIEIPEDINTGMATLAISGGFSGLSDRRPSEEENGNDVNHTVIEGYKSFDEMIEDYLKGPMNNELTLQVYPSLISNKQAPPNLPDGIEKQPEEKQPEQENEDENENQKQDVPEEDKKKPEIKKQVYTDYVLEGNLTLDFEVKNIPVNNGDNNNPADKVE